MVVCCLFVCCFLSTERLLIDAWCLLFVVCGVLSAVCCLLDGVVGCMRCCVLLACRLLSFVGCCFLFVVICGLLCVVCGLSFAVGGCLLLVA